MFKQENTLKLALAITMTVIGLIVVVQSNLRVHIQQQYTIQSESFSRLHLDLVRGDEEEGREYMDMVELGGKYYWALGPFPSILLLPGVVLFQTANLGVFYQGYIQIIIIIGIYILGSLMARKLGFSIADSLLLAFILCLSSSLAGVAYVPVSWYFGNVVAAFLMLAAFYEYFHKDRPLVIGVFIALALATRLTTGIGIVFFILNILSKKIAREHKLNQLSRLSAPIIIALMCLGTFNYLRFGSVLETGYSMQSALPELVAQREKSGLINVRYIPSNFYYYFINTPRPITEATNSTLAPPYVEVDVNGISFFLIAPIFIKILFGLSAGDRKTKLLLMLTAGLILTALLSFYSSGTVTIGPRQMNDTIAILFVLLLMSFTKKSLNISYYIVAIISACFNLFLVLQVYGWLIAPGIYH